MSVKQFFLSVAAVLSFGLSLLGGEGPSADLLNVSYDPTANKCPAQPQAFAKATGSSRRART